MTNTESGKVPTTSPTVQSTTSTPRRVAWASLIGTSLESYDFYLFAYFSAFFVGPLFFEPLGPVGGTLAAFLGIAVGFVVRPIGAIIFGHLGDRIGRKPVLVITLMLVGVGTFLIGLLPTYASAGIWAPVMLVALRLIQGFGAGAEYGGAVILAVEHAPAGKRGLFGSFAAIGVNIGLLLATGVFTLVSSLPQEDFLSWGWRVPFLLSIILIVIGFYIRARVAETPVFSEISAKNKAARSPVKEAFLRHPREFLVVFGARLAENGLGYLYPVFTLNYMTKTLGFEKNMVLTGIMVAYAISLFTVPLFSALSDRIGRRPVYGGAALFSAAFAFPFFMLVDTGSTVLIWISLILAISVGVSGMFGPQAAYFAEMFGAKLRYSGFASARELGSLLAGGPAPFVAGLLVVWMAGAPWGVAGYMVVLSLLTAIAIWFGPETYRSDIHADAPEEKA